MKFWDSSAVVPLLIEEAETRRAIGWFREDSALCVWCLTPCEVMSALHRKVRESTIAFSALAQPVHRLGLLRSQWTEIQAFEAVRERAIRLLAVHPLRSADALQLAAALIATEEKPGGAGFLSFDTRLQEAAAREGFEV